jgi:hypothetical protein
MGRNIAKVVFLSVLLVAGLWGLLLYERHNAGDAALTEERQRRQQAEAKVEALKQVVLHLTSEERKANVIVLDQKKYGDVVHTTLLFQEYAKDGSLEPLLTKRFVIEGDEAHIDALVIKFQGQFVQDKDPLRGRSIALFTRLFDNKSPPENAKLIDDPNHIPNIYKGADPQVSEFEQQLWRDFWKLADDKHYREQMGVDVMQGESVYWRFKPGYQYTITLHANAGLSLRWEYNPSLWEMFQHIQERTSQASPTTGPT